MVKVKICGITNREDADAAVDAGADALGFVFYPRSPRALSPEAAAEIVSSVGPFTVTVGVFANERQETVNEIARKVGLDRVQLHGDESPEYCRAVNVPVIKAFRVKGRDVLGAIPAYGLRAFLLDAFSQDELGGTGMRFDWDIARDTAGLGRLILSGGLTVENVAEAVRRVRPYGVDVSSGVSPEGDKRKKDAAKMKLFMDAARRGCEEGP